MEDQPPNALSQLLDGIQGLAVILASFVAVWGISAWRREHVGRRRIDLAEEALSLFYEAREAINGSRSAINSSAERIAAQQEWSDRQPGSPQSAKAPIIAWRLDQRKDLFVRIRSLRYRFAATFGPVQATPFYDLVQLRDDVVLAEEEFLLLEGQLHTAQGADRERLINELMELSRKMHHGRTASDRTTQQLGQIVEKIERTCRSVIESYGRTLFGAAVVRARRAFGMLKSKPGFARLRDQWMRFFGPAPK